MERRETKCLMCAEEVEKGTTEKSRMEVRCGKAERREVEWQRKRALDEEELGNVEKRKVER